MRKPSRIYQKNKALVMKEFFRVLDVSIPYLQTCEQAQKLESDLYSARSGGMITDAEYVKYHNQIKEVCKENNWAMP